MELTYRQVIGLNNVLNELGNQRLGSVPIQLTQAIMTWQNKIESDINIIQSMVTQKSSELGIKFGQDASDEDQKKNLELQPSLQKWQTEELMKLTTKIDGPLIPLSLLDGHVSINQFRLLSPVVDTKK